REGDHRDPLLHQQLGHGREAIRPSRPGSLGYREYLPLGSRCDVSRGRVADPRQGAAGELCLAQSLHLVTPEAASRPRQPCHETPQLWLERKLPAGSPYRSNALVGAGPESHPRPGAPTGERQAILCVNSRKTTEVSEVGGSNRQDIEGSGGCDCLAGKDRTGIQVLRTRSRYAGVSQECPEVASATHRSRGDRQVKKPPLKLIQPAQARGCSSTHELPSNFVIRDLRNNNVCAAEFE